MTGPHQPLAAQQPKSLFPMTSVSAINGFLWQYEERDGSATKVPYRVGHRCASYKEISPSGVGLKISARRSCRSTRPSR